MPGIEKLVEEIARQGEAAVRSLEAADASRADEILAQGKAAADTEYGVLTAKAGAEAAKRIALAKSTLASENSKEILSAKVKEVDGAVKTALDKILSLDAKDYFAAVERIVLKRFSAGSGEIMFNVRDLKRLPDGFIDSLNSKLDSGAGITLSEKVADIEGGCVIVSGLIEENCSFDAVVREKADAIRDCAAAVLFS